MITIETPKRGECVGKLRGGDSRQVYVLIDAIDGGPIGVYSTFEKARQQGDKEGCVFMVLPMEVE